MGPIVTKVFLPIILVTMNAITNTNVIQPDNSVYIFRGEPSENWINYNCDYCVYGFDTTYVKEGSHSRVLSRVALNGDATGRTGSTIRYANPLDMTNGGIITSSGTITGSVFIPTETFSNTVSSSSLQIKFVDVNNHAMGFSHHKTIDEFGNLTDIKPGWNVMTRRFDQLQTIPPVDWTQIKEVEISWGVVAPPGSYSVYFDDFRVIP